MLRFLTLVTPNFPVFIFHFFFFLLNPNNAQVFLSGMLGISPVLTFYSTQPFLQLLIHIL